VAGNHLLAGAHQHRAPRAEAVEALRGLAEGHQDCFVVTADEPPLDSPPLEELPEDGSPPLEELPEDVDDDSPLLVEPVALGEPDSPSAELEELDSGALAELDSPPLEELVAPVLGAVEELFVLALLDLLLDALAFVPAPRAVALRLTEALSAGSWPEAICTYTTMNAAVNSAALSATTERRMRRARLRMFATRSRPCMRAISCSLVSSRRGRGRGAAL
jgi:hypothetical protein